MALSFSKAEKMRLLDLIHRKQPVFTGTDQDFLLFDLLDDYLIKIEPDTQFMYLTYFGFRELQDWDPILQVSVNRQLTQPSHGDA